MELQEFISQTLTSIINGVDEAKAGNPSHVAPQIQFSSSANEKAEMAQIQGKYQAAFFVGFDVAVTVSTSKEAGAKAGISVIGMGAGGNTSSSTENQSISRIKFKVPIAYK